MVSERMDLVLGGKRGERANLRLRAGEKEKKGGSSFFAIFFYLRLQPPTSWGRRRKKKEEEGPTLCQETRLKAREGGGKKNKRGLRLAKMGREENGGGGPQILDGQGEGKEKNTYVAGHRVARKREDLLYQSYWR